MTTLAIAVAAFMLGGYVNARLDRRARERGLGTYSEIKLLEEQREDMRRRLRR